MSLDEPKIVILGDNEQQLVCKKKKKDTMFKMTSQ